MRISRNFRFIVFGALIGGTFDILYAFAFYGYRGVSATRILQSVASGLLGLASYDGGAFTAALGLFLHFFILVVAATIFYVASRRFDWLAKRWLICGVLFGLAIYAFMNLVVVPLSAFPHKQNFPPAALWSGLFVHAFLVGVPISFFTRKARLALSL